MCSSWPTRFCTRRSSIWLRRIAVLAALAEARLAAQTEIKVYSEFRRIAPDGSVVAPDRTGRPREILSPGVARQAHTSFRIVVTAPPGKRYSLYIGENPEKFFRYSLYKEIWTKAGQEWLPDRIEKVDTPYQGEIPDAQSAAPHQTVQTFWLDVYTPGQAPIQRVRLEAQLNVGDDWIIYPMEVRVLAARLPDIGPYGSSIPPLTAPAAEPALEQLAAYLCGTRIRPGANPPNSRQLVARNAQQDMALARGLEAKKGREAMTAALTAVVGATDLKSWCAERPKQAQSGYDPEQYLRVREWLLKAAEE